jgi:hypothetical protein
VPEGVAPPATEFLGLGSDGVAGIDDSFAAGGGVCRLVRGTAAMVIRTAFAQLSLEAAALVDDLTVDVVASTAHAEGDRAATVDDGVCDKLRNHEREVAALRSTEVVSEPLNQGLSSDAGCRNLAWQR